MKTIWKATVCIVAVLLSFSIYSCGDDDDDAVGHVRRHAEARPQSGRRIDQAEVVVLADARGEAQQLRGGVARLAEGEGGGEEVKLLIARVRRDGVGERAAAAEHVRKVHQRAVAQPEGEVEVAQRDVAVHAQNMAAHRGQRQTDAGGEGGFSGAALAGDHRNQFTHTRSLISADFS